MCSMMKKGEETAVLQEIKEILKLEDPFHLPASGGGYSEEASEILEEIRRIKLENYDLNCALEFSSDSIHITDGEGTVLRVNSVFEEYTGVKREDVVGKNVRYAEAEQIYVPSVVRLCINERRKLTMIQRTLKTGSENDAVTTSNPIFDDEGNIFRVISNARPLKYLSLIYDYYTSMQNAPLKISSGIELSSKAPKMKELLSTVVHIAKTSSGILITGESGTGKTLLARYIHENSTRSKNRFIELNCASIPESLIESELFGYEAGAFTGASPQGKPGLIELAHKGTLFLDEIGDMPLSLQAKLLQVIQSKCITHVGGSEEIPVDIRIISATNKNLEEMVHEGSFRQDLYYRLNIIPLELPPLRQRKEDIPDLIDTFIEKFNHTYKKETLLSRMAYTQLVNYSWPGNIRELENLIERLIATNRDGYIQEEELPDNIRYDNLIYGISKIQEGKHTLPGLLEEVEKRIVSYAYQKYKNSYKVAEVLGISQSGANRKIMKYVTNKNVGTEK